MDPAALAQLTPAQLAQTPAGMPPPGVVPNLVNPHSDGYKFIIVSTVFMVIMALFASLRFYVKVFVVRKTTLDDYTLAIGVFGTVLYFISCCYSVTKGGIGIHNWDLSIGFILSEQFLIPSFLINVVALIVLAFIKVSFLIFYWYIFKPFIWLRRSIYVSIGMTCIFYLAIFIVTVCLTVPYGSQTWGEAFISPRYFKTFSFSIPNSSVSLGLDVIILVLPMLGVAKLQLSPSRKFGVMFMFLTGLFACLCSSLGIYYKQLLTEPAGEGDFAWAVLPVLIVTQLEMCVGISAACMPAMIQLRSKKSLSWSRLGNNSLALSLKSLLKTTRTNKSAYSNNSSEHIVSQQESSVYGKIETEITVTSSNANMRKGRNETWEMAKV